MSNNNEVVLLPGAAVTLRLDGNSLGDCHSKADSALAQGRDHDQRLTNLNEGLARHGELIKKLGALKADETTVDALTGRVLELESALRTRPTRDELAKLSEALREEIRQAAGLSRLLTPAGN